MKKQEKAGSLNTIFIMLIFTLFCPIGTSGQTVRQNQDAVSLQADTAPVYTMSYGRLGSVAGIAAALIGVVFGGLALLRPDGRFGSASGRLGSVVALTAGLIGAIIGGIVVITAADGIGTGNGLGGAVIALILGLTGAAIGALALFRSRRTG